MVTNTKIAEFQELNSVIHPKTRLAIMTYLVGSNDATAQGSPLNYAASGADGQAFDFDGSSWLQITDDSSLNPEHLTISGWIKPDFSGRPAISKDVDVVLEKFDATGGYMVGLAMDDAATFDQAPGPAASQTICSAES